MTSPAIVAGTEVLLGTAAYMSPEQARGKAVDKRADVWAFGCVLYEMLTGERLHKGETVSETVAAVLKESPDLTRVPGRLRRVLRSCLQKDPERRLRDVADWQLLIDDDDLVADDRPAPSRRWLWPVAAAAVVIAAVALAAVLLRQPAQVPSACLARHRATRRTGPELFVRPFPQQLAANSKPDASHWSVATGVAANQPARWNPDGRRLMYLTQTGDLMAVDLEEGPAFKTTGPPKRVVAGLAPAPWTLDARNSRFMILQLAANSGPPPPFTLLLNWLPQLER